MGQATITFRIDEETKNQLDEICKALGMSISGALTICTKMIINKRGLPFEVKLDTPLPKEAYKRLTDFEETDDEETAEILKVLNSMSEEDKKIVKSETTEL